MTYDQFLAALCLWREARNCSPAALAGIWHVILNRLCDPQHRWPRTIPQIILQHAQFSSFLQSDPNVVKFPVDDGGPDWQAWLKCRGVVADPRSADLSDGATNYENEPIEPVDKRPLWAKANPDKLTATIDGVRFYRL
jgi:hypothetical protein